MTASILPALGGSAARPDPSRMLEPRDIRVLHGLADDQLRFGQAEEALILLHLCQHFDPANPDTIRRLARTFVALEEWDAAAAMLAAYERVRPGLMRRAADALLGAVVALGTRGIEEARSRFADFLALRAGETLP